MCHKTESGKKYSLQCSQTRLLSGNQKHINEKKRISKDITRKGWLVRQ